MKDPFEETIPSFEIDHTRLKPGLYISRFDVIYGAPITTFDLRFTRPNCIIDPPLPTAALHTIEHLGAIYLRNYSGWGNEIVYFGPMGCRTGCYAVIAGEYDAHDQRIRELFIHMARFIMNWDDSEVPGATPEGCGNFLDHNLLSAKRAMYKWLEVLESKQLDYDPFVYPE